MTEGGDHDQDLKTERKRKVTDTEVKAANLLTLKRKVIKI